MRPQQPIHASTARARPHHVLVRAYGCDQIMWRFVAPAFVADHRVVLFDLAGCGNADPTLFAMAPLMATSSTSAIGIRELGREPVTFVEHSVRTMIGAPAAIGAPELRGFAREDIEGLLDLLGGNHHAWAARMAPVIIGNPERPALAEDLREGFCRMDPVAARLLARVVLISTDLGRPVRWIALNNDRCPQPGTG